MTSSMMDNDILLMNIVQHKFGMVAGITVADNKIIECPGGIPSDADQATWTTQYEAHVAAVAYKDKRQAEYPTIAELTIALYDTDDKAALEKRRSDTKAKYPKPE